MSEIVCIRPIETNDRPAVRALWIGAIGRGELDGFDPAELDLLLDRLDADDAVAIVADIDGHVAGFLHTLARVLVVDPGRRRHGIANLLVEAVERRAAKIDEPFQLWLPDHNPSAAAFLDALGFAYRTSLWDMHLEPAIAVPAPSFPPEVELVPVDRVHRDDYIEMFNRAFADHPSPLALTPAIVAWAHGRPDFDPTTVNVLIERASGSLVGMIRVRPAPNEGEVALIGLVPEWRGRGLGRELLRWGISRLRSAGASTITLSVEGDNPGALELYQRTGFARTREWRRFARSRNVARAVT